MNATRDIPLDQQLPGRLREQDLAFLLRMKPGHLSQSHIDLLVRDAQADPFHSVLFGAEPAPIEDVVRQRLELFPPAWAARKGLLTSLLLPRLPTNVLWSYVLPLAQYLLPLLNNPARRSFVGVAGGPGAGKTTLTRLLELVISQFEKPGCDAWRILCVSMDDFYYTKEERRQRGFPWRAMPGTHDMALLLEIFSQLKAGAPEVHVPRFEHAIDERKGFERVEGPLHLCLIEGLMADGHCPGHEQVNQLMDYLIYLDLEPKVLKRKRLLRESRVRRYTHTGFSTQKLLRFWEEAIEPLLKTYFPPIKERADLLVSLSPRLLPVGGVVRRPPSPD